MRQIKNGLKGKSWFQDPMVPCVTYQLLKEKKHILYIDKLTNLLVYHNE